MLSWLTTLSEMGVVVELTYPSGAGLICPEDESQECVKAYFVPPKKRNYPVQWLLVWQDESTVGVSMTEQAEMEKPLTQTEYRVRDWLIGTIGLGNYVYVNQAEMARKLRIERATANRAVKRLVKLGIILEGPKSGKSNTYMINPAFMFKGGLGTGIEARKEAIQNGKAKVIHLPLPGSGASKTEI